MYFMYFIHKNDLLIHLFLYLEQVYVNCPEEMFKNLFGLILADNCSRPSGSPLVIRGNGRSV